MEDDKGTPGVVESGGSGCKYILLIGGVLSGLGKGTIASSIGRLFRSHDFRVTAIKIDPYLNIDAGTMSPFEHGEVFVLNDGAEVDLDLGNYERFLDVQLNRDNNITTGKIYDIVIKKERKGLYLGKTVQVVPHICNEIQDWILRVSRQRLPEMREDPEICLIELGGTVGDIESMPFIEAMRQFQFRVGRSNLCVIHVSLVPMIGVVGEQKTKPTQQSVQQLRALGLSPDIILCRSAKPMSAEARLKISNFCHVSYESVLGLHDVSNLYRIPQLLYDQRIFALLHRQLNIPMRKTVDFDRWIEIANTVERLATQAGATVRIAMVGKYTELVDAYISVFRALQHACYELELRMEVDYIEASELESGECLNYEKFWGVLRRSDAVIVPGGFGDRGVEGKVLGAKYARESGKPYLGICLGMQISVIEYARSVLGWVDANSEEFAQNTEHPVIVFMPEISKAQLGGTMRLGQRRTFFRNKNSLIYRLYRRFGTRRGLAGEGESDGELEWVDERHRHRYEVNVKYVDALSKAGMDFVGQDETGERQEMIEVPGHPFYVAVQYHPEFLSRPNRPSPLFYGLMMAASGRLGGV